MASAHGYLSAGLAVALAAIFAIVYTAYFNHLNSKNDIIKEYLKDLDEIERLCREYWLYDPAPTEADCKLSNIGHELRAKIQQTSYFEELSKNVLSKNYEKFSNLDVQLYMTATGGKFQTSEFTRSPETFGEVMSIVSEIRNLLRSQRNSMFWAR